MTTDAVATTNNGYYPAMPVAPHTQILNPTDMAELGSLLTAAGLSTVAARNVVDRVQRMATQVALATIPELLEDLRKVGEFRMQEMERDIRTLPQTLGYVSRDRVLQVVRVAAARPAQI